MVCLAAAGRLKTRETTDYQFFEKAVLLRAFWSVLPGAAAVTLELLWSACVPEDVTYCTL